LLGLSFIFPGVYLLFVERGRYVGELGGSWWFLVVLGGYLGKSSKILELPYIAREQHRGGL